MDSGLYLLNFSNLECLFNFELEVCVKFGFLHSYFQYYFFAHISNLLLMEYFDIRLGL